MKVTAPAQVNKVSTMADGSIKMEVYTQELPPAEMATLFELRKNIGWFLFSANQVQEDEVPKEEAEFQERSPGQRLRGSLYRLWEQRGKHGTFETFYRSNLERLITQVKEQLE